MMIPQLPLTLSADVIEALFALVFFGVAFVGWIINLINGNKPQQKNARQQKTAQQRKQVQNDIEKFLNQGRGEQARPESVRPNPPQQKPDAPRRPAPPPSRKPEKPVAKQGNRPSKPPAQPVQKSAAESAAVFMKPGEGLAARHVGSTIGSTVERDLPHQVNSNVAAHLGTFRADDAGAIGQMGISATTSRREAPASLLREMLRSPQGVRQAVLLNEVLHRRSRLKPNPRDRSE